jgi:hypothetical protein
VPPLSRHLAVVHRALSWDAGKERHMPCCVTRKVREGAACPTGGARVAAPILLRRPRLPALGIPGIAALLAPYQGNSAHNRTSVTNSPIVGVRDTSA